MVSSKPELFSYVTLSLYFYFVIVILMPRSVVFHLQTLEIQLDLPSNIYIYILWYIYVYYITEHNYKGGKAKKARLFQPGLTPYRAHVHVIT